MLELSCALAPSRASPDLAAYAEELGYARVWCYDSPALYGDVWIALARAADRTERIGLGPAVLVPSLRHPMANAAAIATLADLAPGRVAVAIGAGFTGRYLLGQRAMRWDDVERYVLALRGLLRGDEIEWQGSILQMLHSPGTVANRPIEVPFLVGADGPKGRAAAERVADGVIWGGAPSEPSPTLPWRALLQFGTVLEPGESPWSDRVLATAGHGAAVAYHAAYEHSGERAVRALPGGSAWCDAVENTPIERRHLTIHDGHLTGLNDIDQTIAADAAGLLTRVTLTGAAHEIRARVERLAARGVTELVYQPAGRDPARELRAMAAAVGITESPGSR